MSVLTLRGSVLIYPQTMGNHTICGRALQGYLDRDKIISRIIARVRPATSASTHLRRRERSNLGPFEENWRRGMVEQVADRGATTEPVLSDSPATETFVGGFMIPHQRSGTPRAQSDPALGLTTTLPLSNAPTPPPKPKSSASVPYIKPPTASPLTRLTTPALHLASEKAALRIDTCATVQDNHAQTQIRLPHARSFGHEPHFCCAPHRLQPCGTRSSHARSGVPFY